MDQKRLAIISRFFLGCKGGRFPCTFFCESALFVFPRGVGRRLELSTGAVEAKKRNSKGGLRFVGAIPGPFGVVTPKTASEKIFEDDDAS